MQMKFLNRWNSCPDPFDILLWALIIVIIMSYRSISVIEVKKIKKIKPN